MQITEQAKILAEEKYPDLNEEQMKFHLALGNINQATDKINTYRQIFIQGFTESKWVEVTPDSMPEESGWYVVWHQKWTNWTRLYYDKSDNAWSNGTSKNIDLSQLNCSSYFQIIEPPKPSK